MTTAQKMIEAKGGLLELAKPLGNVADACRIRGASRDRFYRCKELSDRGEAARPEISRRRPNHTDRVDSRIDAAMVGRYCAAQDTFSVGTFTGGGRIYQQTVIDTCSTVAAAKL